MSIPLGAVGLRVLARRASSLLAKDDEAPIEAEGVVVGDHGGPSEGQVVGVMIEGHLVFRLFPKCRVLFD